MSVWGVDNRRITLIVIHARANGAVVILLMEFVQIVRMEMEIQSIFQLRTLLTNLQAFLTTPHTINQSCVNFAGTMLVMVTIHAQPKDVQELLNKLLQDLQSINKELANFINTPNWNRPAFYHDDNEDDDEEYTIVITPVLPTEKPDNSLSMGDEHLSTTPKTESDELIKSSDENLVPIPSESEDFSDIESECDVPDCDDSQTTNFSTFSNPLFDDSTSSDDESSHEEVIHEISFKTYSNPLFDLDEEIISSEFNPIHNEDLDSTLKNDRFDTESYLLESLLNRDTLMASSPKIDSLFDEFADNSSPRPPEDFHANPNTIIESLPTFPIPIEDSDSLREEIDKFPGPDDSIPPGIKSDDYDSEDSTIDVVEDIPVDVPNILPTHPTLHMDFDFIPSHNDLGFDLDVSSPFGDRNKIYDPGICIEVESTRFLATLSGYKVEVGHHLF
ncbi:hypothetical protein Tco_1094051 [Tanacetum coccineum]|uniref:Uncharacterized protein n=1 Tax=Tanacetum coccineum TaxID=301880 RepID=A0ABQ5IEJ2_9ASTR